MRLSPLSLLLVLPFLAACNSNAPDAPSGDTAATTPAKVTPTKAPASTAKFPISARPLLGTWAADAAGCANAKLVTAVSQTSYTVGGKSCEIALADKKDGTFTATCGKQTLTLTPIFGPTGEGIRIAVGDAKPANVFRCSR